MEDKYSISVHVFSFFEEARFGGRQLVAGASPEAIQSGQEEDADQQLEGQAADNDDSERPLRVRANFMGHGGGEQSQGSHQHGHHDGTQAQRSSFLGGFLYRAASHAKLVDVFHHDDAGLHGDADQRQETQAGGNTEVGPGG